MPTLVGNYSFLLSAQPNVGTGVGGVGSAAVILDNRRSQNYGQLMHVCTSPSAVIGMDASHDGTGFVRVLTVTASPTTALVQVSAYYPYLRAVLVSGYGGGGATASAYAHWAGGLQSVMG